MNKEDINSTKVFHEQAVKFIIYQNPCIEITMTVSFKVSSSFSPLWLLKVKLWNWNIFPDHISTLCHTWKPLFIVNLWNGNIFPDHISIFVTHGGPYLLWELIPKSISERADDNVVGKQAWTSFLWKQKEACCSNVFGDLGTQYVIRLLTWAYFYFGLCVAPGTGLCDSPRPSNRQQRTRYCSEKWNHWPKRLYFQMGT